MFVREGWVTVQKISVTVAANNLTTELTEMDAQQICKEGIGQSAKQPGPARKEWPLNTSEHGKQLRNFGSHR